jgi:regulator of protease activity HflC (stomatin/prohibitin superfamily)
MNPITALVTTIFAVIGVLLFGAGSHLAGAGFGILAGLTAFALKMANNWERFVILRAGQLSSVKGPGLFVIIPVIDSVTAVIDERIQTTAFNAEQALTRDTVPVNVDAIVFWHVHDAQRAALNITNYREAIDRVSQTSLREMIGSSHLSALLADRAAADEVLRAEIARKTADWGISVNSVEIRDVAIPVALQDAMSRQAQAEREKEARVILGSAEAAIAAKFVEAARTYAGGDDADGRLGREGDLRRRRVVLRASESNCRPNRSGTLFARDFDCRFACERTVEAPGATPGVFVSRTTRTLAPRQEKTIGASRQYQNCRHD